MKGLASDFDGTLYFGYSGSKGQGFKEEDLKEIRCFQESGNLFGICSGRPFQGIQHASKEALENKDIEYDFYIVSTGAIILDKNQNILFVDTMPYDLSKQLVEQYKDTYQVYTHVGTENIYTYNQKGGFPIPQNVVSCLDDIQSDCILGVSIECKQVDVAEKVYKELLQQYGEVLSIYINSSDIDIVNKGVSKGAACKKLKELLNLDTLCGIGDNYNDIPMLNSTDYSFTFTYSPKEVQEKADEVVESLAKAIVNLNKQKG